MAITVARRDIITLPVARPPAAAWPCAPESRNREAAMTIIRIAAIMLALFGIATEDRAAVAQTYPSKPIKLVVPYPPGGPNDVIARILAQKLAEGLGGTFFVENTAGAGGT
jgi:hypothetical protein